MILELCFLFQSCVKTITGLITVCPSGLMLCFLHFVLIMLTSPCNVDPLSPHFYIVNMGFTWMYIISLFFALKQRAWVLVSEAVLTCTNDLSFEQKLKKKYHNFSSENFRFYNREILQYIS